MKNEIILNPFNKNLLYWFPGNIYSMAFIFVLANNLKMYYIYYPALGFIFKFRRH